MPEYEQGQAGLVFADGVYLFQVADAGERTSKETHNVMIELQLDCYDTDLSAKIRVVDRLVFVPNSYWKIDSFRRATGEKISEGKKVSFEAEDCIDRRGKVQLKTTSYNGKARNEVDYYVEPEEATTTSATAPAAKTQADPATSGAQPVAAPAAKGTVPKAGQSF